MRLAIRLTLLMLLAAPLAAQLPQFHPVPDTYERLLLPVFTEPVKGAFGSEFHTTLRLSNKTPGHQAPVYGLEPVCHLSACIGWDFFNDFLTITDFDDVPEVYFSGTPGWFLYVPKSAVNELTMNLRVHDVTRSSLNYGTEIPIVRSREFRDSIVVFSNVPTDPRFRNTLRIYSTMGLPVGVKVGNNPPVTVQLGGATDIFHPAYATFTDFPIGTQPVKVVVFIEPLDPPIPAGGIWAFITVTNNETHTISTITPQP